MAAITKHRDSVILELCKRDYVLLGEHHNELLETIEKAISAGATPDDIRTWAVITVDESLVVQRCYNAARWVERIKE